MKQVFPATFAGLEACQRFLAGICRDPKPQIITDEIVSNIVRCSGSADFEIEVEMTDDPSTVRLVFVDGGVPFDPTKTKDPDIRQSVDDRVIGGLGLFMVRKMSKSVEYARRDGKNVLTVILAR